MTNFDHLIKSRCLNEQIRKSANDGHFYSGCDLRASNGLKILLASDKVTKVHLQLVVRSLEIAKSEQ